MKAKLSLTVLLLITAHSAISQVSIRETIRFRDTIKVEKYRIPEFGFKSMKVNMQPGKHHILNPEDVEFLSKQTIVQVDLVYSNYPKDADLSQLNRKRILELNILLPEAFGSMVKWNLVQQTGIKSASDMNNYYHGFVVFYRPMPTLEEENKAILSVVNQKTKSEDSTLLKVFARQPKWKNMLVVTDVTGSMSPYTAQILLWIKANSTMNTFKQIVFFNDNEENSNDQSAKLDTSGIWSIETTNSDKVVNLALKAMANGNHIENNLEAICYAIKKFPENKANVVMIADNWENPCDMKLLEFLKKQKIPVRIVICGVTDRLNTSYLEIAFATGGSVHTMEEDLKDIATLGEGKTIKIGNMTFKMQGGKFIQLYMS